MVPKIESSHCQWLHPDIVKILLHDTSVKWILDLWSTESYPSMIQVSIKIRYPLPVTEILISWPLEIPLIQNKKVWGWKYQDRRNEGKMEGKKRRRRKNSWNVSLFSAISRVQGLRYLSTGFKYNEKCSFFPTSSYLEVIGHIVPFYGTKKPPCGLNFTPTR